MAPFPESQAETPGRMGILNCILVHQHMQHSDLTPSELQLLRGHLSFLEENFNTLVLIWRLLSNPHRSRPPGQLQKSRKSKPSPMHLTPKPFTTGSEPIVNNFRESLGLSLVAHHGQVPAIGHLLTSPSPRSSSRKGPQFPYSGQGALGNCLILFCL